MKSKNKGWPYWLKDGLIGLIIFFIFLLLKKFTLMVILAIPLLGIFDVVGIFQESGVYVVRSILGIYYFFIAIIIGLIIRKIPKKEDVRMARILGIVIGAIIGGVYGAGGNLVKLVGLLATLLAGHLGAIVDIILIFFVPVILGGFFGWIISMIYGKKKK